MVQSNKLLKNMMHPCRNIFKRPFFAIKLFKKCDWISWVRFYFTCFFCHLVLLNPPPPKFQLNKCLWVFWPERGWTQSTLLKCFHQHSSVERSSALEETNNLVFVLYKLTQLQRWHNGEERNKSHWHRHNYTILLGSRFLGQWTDNENRDKEGFFKKRIYWLDKHLSDCVRKG